MKRLTARSTRPVYVVRQGGHDGPVIGYRIEETFLAVADGWEFALDEVPDPLPTEPGVRFWGRCDLLREPQWWISQGYTGEDAEGAVETIYRPLVTSDCTFYVYEADRAGLVRLPDPDVTP